MARYFGQVGYVEDVETAPSVYKQQVTEKPYYGDEIIVNRRLESGERINDNVVIGNKFSILADAYAYEHFSAIRYITWMGKRWKVKEATVQRPRIVLDIGGLWNGKTPESR